MDRHARKRTGRPRLVGGITYSVGMARSRVEWLFVAAMAVSACSASERGEVVTESPAADSAATESTESAGGNVGWSVSTLGEPPVDAGVETAVDTNGTTVVVSSNQGALVAWFDDGDGLTPASVDQADDASAEELLSFSGVESTSAGFVVVGSGLPGFEPQVWRSTDGTSWAQLETVGFNGPAEVNSITRVGDDVVVGGTLRDGDNGESGGFEPVVWRTDDLVTWSRVRLAADVEGWVSEIVSTQSGLMAFGSQNNVGAIWRSTDDGSTWERDEVAARTFGRRDWAVMDTAVLRDMVVAVGWSMEGEHPLLAYSLDGGVTWTRPDTAALRSDGVRVVRDVEVVRGAFWALTSSAFDASGDADRCYEDIELCERAPKPVVLRSDDGVRWDELDLDAIESGDLYQFDAVVGTDDRVSLVGVADDLKAWTWSSADLPPVRATSERPPESETPLVKWGAELTIGELVRFPLYTHCGIDVLGQFNDNYWYLAATPEGSTEIDWPTTDQTILGVMTLIDADTIEYRTPAGELIGVYEPSDVEPPGCA